MRSGLFISLAVTFVILGVMAGAILQRVMGPPAPEPIVTERVVVKDLPINEVQLRVVVGEVLAEAARQSPRPTKCFPGVMLVFAGTVDAQGTPSGPEFAGGTVVCSETWEFQPRDVEEAPKGGY